MRWDGSRVRLTVTRDSAAILTRYQGEALTYEAVAATRGELPNGYRHTRRRIQIGSGPDALDRSADFLSTWEMHRRCGLTVVTDGPAQPGRTVVLKMGRGLSLVIPCRVVYVVDEPSRRGFAYGTLPDHPEEGEEAFIVTHDDNGSVWFEITAFSRPGAPLVRWAGPLGRAIQAASTTRYQRTVASALAT